MEAVYLYVQTEIHVVDTCPHRFERNACLAIVVNHLDDVKDILVTMSENLAVSDYQGHFVGISNLHWWSPMLQ
jgi:hypothetical protein